MEPTEIIQAAAAVASLIVAIAAIAVGLSANSAANVANTIATDARDAEAAQADAARNALALAREQAAMALASEIARRAEVQISSAQPLEAGFKGPMGRVRAEGRYEVLSVKNPGPSVVFGVTVCNRGIAPDGTVLDGECVGYGSLGLDEVRDFSLGLQWFIADGRRLADAIEFEVVSKGLLGQEVRQVVVLRLDRLETSSADKWWWEARRVLIPHVADAAPVELTFDG